MSNKVCSPQIRTMASATQMIKALEYSSRLARFQFRKDGVTPQIYHSIGIATILSTMAAVTDSTVLTAALLIDVCDDPDISFEKIEKDYGSRIKKIIHELSDDKNVWKDKATFKCPNVIYTYTHMSNDARLIKLADRLYCVNEICRATPIGWDNVRVQAYYEWVKQLLDAGLRGLCPAIEKEIDAVLTKRGLLTAQDQKKLILKN